MSVDYKVLKNGGFMRQKQKDQFSLRLKVVGGNLSADQLETVVTVARKFGEGRVHFTSRQGVEIPFIKLNDVEAVKAELAEGGVSAGVCGPRVRTVTACQGCEICPSGCIDTYPLAVEIDRRYYGKELPHKFKFGVTGCQNNCLKAEENDLGIKGGLEVTWKKSECIFCGVCIKACRNGAITGDNGELAVDREKCNFCGRCVKSCPVNAWEGESGYLLSFGGLFGNNIARGKNLLPFIKDREILLRVIDAAVEFFMIHGNTGERFKITVDRIGWNELQRVLDATFQQSGKNDEDTRIDLTSLVCPASFLKAKEALDELPAGERLIITLNDGDQVQNIPRGLKAERHKILRLTDNGNSTYDLTIEKIKTEAPETEVICDCESCGSS